MSNKKPYPETTTKPDFPAIEREMLDFWNENKIFEKSVAQREGAEEFVFYDGPPFGNGLPHYGHAMQSYNKDTAGRYQTMKGRQVRRRWGWDCHGLPPELKTEKDLNLSGKKQIEAYGIDKFVEKCRKDVMSYVGEWRGIINRMGRWADMAGAYKTMDKDYTESVLWAFKELYGKGLIYEDFRVVPYSWAAETVLSNFEVNQPGCYRDRTDTTITTKFACENGLTLLGWTTTPWTTPSNLMIAVGAEIEYSVFEGGITLATNCVDRYRKELGSAKLEKIILGRELAGLSYKPLFGYFAGTPGAFKVLAADFVTDDDGTGIVHIAPGFGEDDFALCRAYDPNFPIICPVDERGRFTAEVADWAGMQVFDANEPIAEALKERGLVFQRGQITHQYPHCWRTDKPLIYRAQSGWYVKVTAFKRDLVESNQKINWIPEHIRDGRFGKWLEGARDWSISRNRFWGAPIPAWKSDDPEYPFMEVLGSVAEIEERAGRQIDDLHRPYIDITYPNPKDPTGKSKMTRVPDVFDCWFESGAMPFASIHYPFENKEWFKKNFPADFIAEGLDQTRGWFYTMAVLGQALFGRIPYKNCGCTGLVFDDKGQKLSKKLGNYSEPSELFEKYGSDAMRWFFLSSSGLKGGNVGISKEGAELAKTARNSIIPLYNAYHFFTLYANADGIKAKYDRSSLETMDRYVLALLDRMTEKTRAALDAYDTSAATQAAERFLDALNNWYIRLSRERFWGTGTEAKSQQRAFDTLYVALSDFCRACAPLMPFTADYIYKRLTGEESVHLALYPEAREYDAKLAGEMDLVRDICSAAKTLREEKGIKVRQPLSKMTIASARDVRAYSDIIIRESNVKAAEFARSLSDYADKSLYIFTPVVGKRLGPRLAEIQRAARAGDYTVGGGIARVAGTDLLPGEFEERVSVKGQLFGRATADNTAVVLLDPEITPELETEGRARDFIREVQEARKSAGLNVSDRIRLFHDTQIPPEWEDEVKKVTLAVELIQWDELKVEKT
ncbi:MAG: isoleucine--tRNA ligase [Rickettsiales bacterium]|jgi:isoleucyl-tRNA synthetase|nr:isoleucine--tRNA ligase [Rickettsiales bacterium]